MNYKTFHSLRILTKLRTALGSFDTQWDTIIRGVKERNRSMVAENAHFVDPVTDNEKQFNAWTIELLAHKYRYYKMDDPIVSDYEYDALERRWESLGESLGIDIRNYPHWVGFDARHPLAGLALEWLTERGHSIKMWGG